MSFGTSHPFRVSWPGGAVRSFSTFEMWNVYLLAIEKDGRKWILSDDGSTALVQVLA